MKAYKGFNKDMTCRGFQFEEGKTYHEDKAELCRSGFHACESPLDCLSYYVPAHSVYHEVELDDVSPQTEADTKRCGKTIKIGARLDALGLCKAHFEYTKSKTTTSEQGVDNANISAQDGCSVSARNCSSVSAQDGCSVSARNCSSVSAQDGCSVSAREGCSVSAQDGCSVSAQDGSSLSAGKNSVIAAFNSKAKGGLNTLIALANREWIGTECTITDFKAAIIDGKTLMPDTWYKLKNGEFVEVSDDE
jgi:hypothetical protein